MLVYFPYFFAANPYSILVDGTDEGNEGNWSFTFTDEQPFFTDNVGIDLDKNCLQILPSSSIAHTVCDNETDYSVFCESESNYSQFDILVWRNCALGIKSWKKNLQF